MRVLKKTDLSEIRKKELVKKEAKDKVKNTPKGASVAEIRKELDAIRELLDLL